MPGSIGAPKYTNSRMASMFRNAAGRGPENVPAPLDFLE